MSLEFKVSGLELGEQFGVWGSEFGDKAMFQVPSSRFQVSPSLSPHAAAGFSLRSWFKFISIIMFITVIFLMACGHRDLRGQALPSPDGKTYLVIDDDNGGGCLPIKIDGKDWPYRIHEIGPIDPGVHNISCGKGDSGIGFEIPKSTIYHFDYWVHKKNG